MRFCAKKILFTLFNQAGQMVGRPTRQARKQKECAPPAMKQQSTVQCLLYSV